VVPPGVTGPEFELTLGVAPFFLPWTADPEEVPNAVGRMASTFSWSSRIRIWGARSTWSGYAPGGYAAYTIPGATHYFVLEGSVDITGRRYDLDLKAELVRVRSNGFASRSRTRSRTGPGAGQ